MTLKIEFHRAASNEFIEASAWHEEKRIGLGTEFVEEIDGCVLLAAQSPLRYPIVYQDIRRVSVNRFPYNIYFRVEKYQIVILAVFHSRRNPAIWKARI